MYGLLRAFTLDKFQNLASLSFSLCTYRTLLQLYYHPVCVCSCMYTHQNSYIVMYLAICTDTSLQAEVTCARDGVDSRSMVLHNGSSTTFDCQDICHL